MVIKKISIFLLCLLPWAAGAQLTLKMAHEFVPGNDGGEPQMMTVFNSKLYISAIGPNVGRELWRYDGTTATLAADINPGTGGGINSYAFQKMAELGGKLYFPGYTDTTGIELMVYDGTNPPAVAADLYPGTGTSGPYELRAVNGQLYFAAETPAIGNELYVYDGVNPPVSFDLYPGILGSSPRQFTSYHSKVYFVAENLLEGTELWVYDPVANTATVAADIVPGGGSSNPYGLVVANGKLYFSANTAADGTELWSYDGTNATRETNIGTGTRNGMTGSIAVYHNALYFSGNNSTTPNDEYQLYKYDLATGNSSLVQVFDPAGLPVTNFYVFKDQLYFAAATSAAGYELWMHDGTHTNMVVDFNPGAMSCGINDLTEYNGALYLGARTAPALESELYKLTDVSGISQAALQGEIAVWPNPATGDAVLAMDLQQGYTCSVAVTDALGRTVWTAPAARYATGTHRLHLPLATQPAGQYYYRVYSGDKILAAGKVIRK